MAILSKMPILESVPWDPTFKPKKFLAYRVDSIGRRIGKIHVAKAGKNGVGKFKPPFAVKQGQHYRVAAVE